MTAKERREHRRLEIRMEELTKTLAHVQGVANALLAEKVELSIAMKSVQELLEEALSVIAPEIHQSGNSD